MDLKDGNKTKLVNKTPGKILKSITEPIGIFPKNAQPNQFNGQGVIQKKGQTIAYKKNNNICLDI